jgi:hypothetical protein
MFHVSPNSYTAWLGMVHRQYPAYPLDLSPPPPPSVGNPPPPNLLIEGPVGDTDRI